MYKKYNYKNQRFENINSDNSDNSDISDDESDESSSNGSNSDKGSPLRSRVRDVGRGTEISKFLLDVIPEGDAVRSPQKVGSRTLSVSERPRCKRPCLSLEEVLLDQVEELKKHINDINEIKLKIDELYSNLKRDIETIKKINF